MSEWSVKHRATSLPRHCRAELIGDALLDAFTPRAILNSWKSTGMWPVDLTKALAIVEKTCTKETQFQAPYARFVAVEDPLPVDQIDEKSHRRLRHNGIDVAGFRAYTIAVRDLDETSALKERSPTKTLIKVAPKRLLTHADCMEAEEQKQAKAREFIEMSLMKFEDGLSKKVAKEELRIDKAAKRVQLKAAAL
jgi:hypothetical protein